MSIIYLIMVIIILMIFLFIILINKKMIEKTNNCKNNLKKEIIEPFLKSHICNLFYDIESGLDIDEYKRIGFFGTNGYKSTSKIVINDNLVIYDVEIVYSNSEGLTYVFCGYVSKIKLNNNLNCQILIKNKKMIESLFHNQRKPDMKTDNEEFDKYFSIKTDNIKISKMILSEEIISYLLKMLFDIERYTYKKDDRKLYPFINKFDIAIVNDYLYVNYEPYSQIRYNYLSKKIDNKILENIYDSISYVNLVSNELCCLINKLLKKKGY